MISFKISRSDRAIVAALVERAAKLALIEGREERISAEMDLIATHANGNPLRFADLLAADDFNFTHDFVGIANCLDRTNGRLMNYFSPRFSDRVSHPESA